MRARQRHAGCWSRRGGAAIVLEAKHQAQGDGGGHQGHATSDERVGEHLASALLLLLLLQRGLRLLLLNDLALHVAVPIWGVN